MNEFEKSFEYTDDSIEAPRPETWAASPIDLYRNDEIRQQQLSVGRLLVERAEEAGEVLGLSKGLSEAISVSTIQRFHYESTLNLCNYTDRLNEVPEDIDNMSLEFLGSYERSMNGTATPYDLLQVRSSLGMASIELAKLSHVGGIGIDDLDVMRQSVRSGVSELGGVMYDEDDVEVSLSLISNDSLMLGAENGLNAITMTRKRLIGEMEDGTSIREKSQFVLRIDEESGFDQKVAARIRSFEIKDGETWRSHIVGISGFEDAVMEALEKDRYEVAIPLVTTIYGYNKETEELVKEKKSQEKLKKADALAQKATSSVVFLRDTDGSVHISNTKNS